MTANELLENYEKLVKFIEDSFEGERKEKLMWLYENLSDRIATAPASMKKQYHNAYPGGYVAHVLNVIKAAEKVYKVWEEMGAEFNKVPKPAFGKTKLEDFAKIFAQIYNS